jgi:Mg2+-importing ATPase
MRTGDEPFWSLPAAKVLQRLGSTSAGLTASEAESRLQRAPRRSQTKPRATGLRLFLKQFASPIVLLLVFTAAVSFFLHDPGDATIILGILIASAVLGFWQEHRSARAVEKLLSLVQTRAFVLRDGRAREIPVEDVVAGDVVEISAGSALPGDCLLLSSQDLFVDEAALTGESFPVEKSVGVLKRDAALATRSNSLFLGTHVISGSARAVVVRTGPDTEFGKLSQRLQLRPPETEFERGVRRFGYLLLEVTLLLVIAIFALNVYLARPALESLLFSLALAVGLTPQLLPAIITVNLAHGARRMAEARVIVKRLASIENFGSMNVLCSDKTGTLTRGVAEIHSARDLEGEPSEKVLYYAYLNAAFQGGYANPLDDAIRRYRAFDLSGCRKVDEIPYDFVRKRLSVVVDDSGQRLLVTKGAVRGVLEVSTRAEAANGSLIPIERVRPALLRQWEALSQEGLRTLGIAYRAVEASMHHQALEADLTFLGFLVVHDPPAPQAGATIRELADLGVTLKVITGDNPLVAAAVMRNLGLSKLRILSGTELRRLSDEALLARVNDLDVFAEVEPNQKERIILALRKSGNVVGFMGDGINDAPALHAADVGISVQGAVDVAKEAADIVLMESDLRVLLEGVRAGRRTFANTLKYVFMATSANFGNMASVAGASLFLPFLPLLPKQILLTNLLTDFPEMAIAADTVDPELVSTPHRWDMGFIRRFMFTFGLLSSVFDYLTFAVLLVVLHATPDIFRTGWFLESVVSAALVVLIIRGRRPFFRSRPGKALLLATALSVGVTLALPWTVVARAFGFVRPPIAFLGGLAVIVVMYGCAAEFAKRRFYAAKPHAGGLA